MRSLAMISTFLAGAICTPTLTADERRSDELQVLDRFIGTWDVEVSLKPAKGEETTLTIVSTRSWSLGGRLLRSEGPNNLKSPDAPEVQILQTYDPKTNTYPGVLMNGPARSEITGRWDAKTKTMAYVSTLPSGNKLESKHRFIGEDRAESTATVTNAAGAVVLEVSQKLKRRKK